MNFIKRIFGKGEEVKNLHKIASELAKRTETQRAKWFDACIEGMRIMSEKMKVEKFKNTSLQGNTDLIIKSFQLVHILSFINMRGYLNSEDMDAFTKILCNYVCGDEIDKCTPYINRYSEIKKEKRGEQFMEQFLLFSEDIALSITGSSIGMLLAPGIDATVFDFYTRNLSLTAHEFGDNEIAEQLFQSIEQMHDIK